MLKSDDNLTIAQTSHCDQAVTYSYKRANKFNLSAIVGVENHSFLYINHFNHQPPQRVLIERGVGYFIC